MLGRLRMSVQEAIEAYTDLAKDVFSNTKIPWKEGNYKATNLERAIKIIVGRYGVPEPETSALSPQERDKRDEQVGSNVRMLQGQTTAGDRGRVFVCSLMADNLTRPTRFRTYDVPNGSNSIPDCCIWEAARATSAAPKFFKPALITEDHTEMRYIDGGLRCNNPTNELLNESANYFTAGREVACILSIGTGRRGKIQLPDVGMVPKLQLWHIVKLLQKISLDCERTHQELEIRFHRKNTYFRFNVDHGMENVGLAEWDKNSSIRADTRTYTQDDSTDNSINKAVEAIIDRRRGRMMTIGQAVGHL
ncbi:hypothetical protein FRC12_020889 [Ceratobasidium sp. 428]|nr:hypothetical protein FRC12_020889 [Ceratobasidium sp. 428]